MDDVRIERRGMVGWVLLDRGDGRNSLRPGTLAELSEAIDAFEQDKSVRAIVLAANGKHFSAGADFSFLEELVETPAVAIREQIYALFQGTARKIYQSRKPTVAAIQGAAVTVACELALCCDYRIAADTAFFQESWIRLGIMPPLGGLFLLPRLVGLGRAKEIALTGRKVGAEEAARIGLTCETTTEVDLHARAQAFAAELAALPPLAYGMAKEAMHRGLDSSMESEWSANVLAQAILLGSEDFKIGLAAAKDRKTGQFNGS